MKNMKTYAVEHAKGHALFANDNDEQIWEKIENPLKIRIQNDKKKRDLALVSISNLHTVFLGFHLTNV
jgi:hypothetical protein